MASSSRASAAKRRLPTIFPAITALGFDPIWFGVVTVLPMEMGQMKSWSSMPRQ